MSDRILLFRRKVSEFPNNALFKFSLGQALFEDDQYKEAAQLFEGCLHENDQWMMAALFLGKAYLALGDGRTASGFLQRAKELAILQKHDDPLQEAEDLLAELS